MFNVQMFNVQFYLATDSPLDWPQSQALLGWEREIKTWTREKFREVHISFQMLWRESQTEEIRAKEMNLPTVAAESVIPVT